MKKISLLLMLLLTFLNIIKGEGDGYKFEKNDARELLSTVENGDLVTLQKLLVHGKWVRSQDDQGRTALMSAAKNGHFAIVEELLANGSDINARDINGISALRLAVQNYRESIVLLLLGHGAEVCEADLTEPTTVKISTLLKLYKNL